MRAALPVALGCFTLVAPAAAQSVAWSWGGSGRELLSVPAVHRTGAIIVSFSDRRLYHVIAPGRAMAYPIAIPREGKSWTGMASITAKRINPPWTPTAEMRADNPSLPAQIPGGDPNNPLGSHALYLGASEYRIHGTDAPWTIGQNLSRGCIRMLNRDVADLYARAPVGTIVHVTWDRFHPG